MSNLQDAIIHLIESPHYKELADYKPPFNPFEVLRVSYRELTHSSVLAWLLADETNTGFTRNFLDWMARYEECQGRERFQGFYQAKPNPHSINTAMKRICHCSLPISSHRSLDKIIQNEYSVLSGIVA